MFCESEWDFESNLWNRNSTAFVDLGAYFVDTFSEGIRSTHDGMKYGTMDIVIYPLSNSSHTLIFPCMDFHFLLSFDHDMNCG